MFFESEAIKIHHLLYIFYKFLTKKRQVFLNKNKLNLTFKTQNEKYVNLSPALKKV